MLVHICCSVDSHYFLQRLKKELPDEPLIGYFYDPNIHPYSEYLLRFNDVKRSCDKLGVDLIMGEYDYELWLNGTKGLENEPEKGKRCSYCFDFRIGESAKKAVELNQKSITTTLLMSPKKDFRQLENSLKNAVAGSGLEIFATDFRICGGTNEQFELAKRDKLYHQNYCGCIFALSKQRQNALCSEMMSDAFRRILPGSIEARLKLYEGVVDCEKNGINFELFRKNFLNYRLLRAFVKFNSLVIPSFFFSYSNFKRQNIKINLDKKLSLQKGLRDGVIMLDITKINDMFDRNFNSVSELCRAEFDDRFEFCVRERLAGTMSLNPIIVVDELKCGKYEIYAKNELYQDSIEVLELH